MLTLKTIDKEFIAGLIKELNATADLSDKGKKNISLMQGLSGLALANFYCGRYLDEPELLAKGEEIIDIIIESIDRENYTFTNVFSLCNGFAGVCFTFLHLQQKGFIEVDVAENFRAVEDYIYEIGLKSISVGKSDYLHGGLGIMYYFMQRMPSPKMKQWIEEMLSAYQKKGKRDEAGFRIVNTVLLGREQNEYDLGLAHGLAGHVIILCDLWKLGINAVEVHRLILDEITYIEHKYRDIEITGKHSYYPSSVIESPGKEAENLDFYDTRLAWCYGDLNMALMYLKLGETFNEEQYHIKGHAIAKNTLGKFDAELKRIVNVFFCHGSAGLTTIYLKIFRDTGDTAFLRASEFWQEITIRKAPVEISRLEAPAGMGLLEGGVGVVLSLLNGYQCEVLDWSNIFLLKA